MLDIQAAGAISIAIAVLLYAATYLSFVRILRFPRNWLRPAVSALLLTGGLAVMLLAHVALSSEGIDIAALGAAIFFSNQCFSISAIMFLYPEPAAVGKF